MWTHATYASAVGELQKFSKTKRLNKQKCSGLWELDEHCRLVRKQAPHQVLLPLDPIPSSEGGFLPGLELGAGDRIRKTHKEMLHAGALKVHQQLTQTMNYFIPRRAVEQTCKPLRHLCSSTGAPSSDPCSACASILANTARST